MVVAFSHSLEGFNGDGSKVGKRLFSEFSTYVAQSCQASTCSLHYRMFEESVSKQEDHGINHTQKTHALVVLSLACSLFSSLQILTGSLASYDRTNALLALTPTATAQQRVAQSIPPTAPTSSQEAGTTATVGATQTVIPTATATPVPSPTHQPTPTRSSPPTPKPTPRPTQPPTCQAVNNNPWCYNFSQGNLITNAPANFCSYFACIPTFVSADDPDGGYTVECQDGMFSQSGGESGSCSHHGGNLQP